jgi:long-subunit acyl-CoA synthetase (AMP-forming)
MGQGCKHIQFESRKSCALRRVEDDSLIHFIYQIDYMVLTWAIQRLNGVCTPVSASSTAEDLEYQLRDSHAKVIFTCEPLLSIALQAATAVGIPKRHVYLIDSPGQTRTSSNPASGQTSVQNLVSEGSKEPWLDENVWEPGQGARQVAFLCYSSGTSGRPVSISTCTTITRTQEANASPPERSPHHT